MKMIKIDGSSSIKGMAYNEELQRMYVEFPNGIYMYFSTTEDEFEQVFLAESRGTKLKEVVAGKSYKKTTQEQFNNQ